MVNHKDCRVCGNKIPITFYCSAKYCSDYCRKVTYDLRKNKVSFKAVERHFGRPVCITIQSVESRNESVDLGAK